MLINSNPGAGFINVNSNIFQSTTGISLTTPSSGNNTGISIVGNAGAYAAFNGVDSPVTQSFGLGIFEELTSASLDVIERFFLDRGAPVLHEVSPFAGAAALDLLCSRNYRPIEISNVLYRPVERPTAEHAGHVPTVISMCASSDQTKPNSGLT